MSSTLAITTEKSLRGFHLLRSLSDDQIKALSARCRWRSYNRGETILDKGGASREVFFILKGSVAIVSFSGAGREVTLATRKAGDFFGELSAIDQEPRSASATAVEKTDLALMGSDVFLELLHDNGPVSFCLLQRLAAVIRTSGLRIMELSTLQAAQRVYAELLRMAQPDAAVPGLWVVRPLPPMHEIASMTSTTRETVNRAISQLYPSNLLKRKGRNLFLMDRAKLEEIVQSLQAHHGRKPKE